MYKGPTDPSAAAAAKRRQAAGRPAARLITAPNALTASSGLSANIPVNGPVYIMRGAVYLEDGYTNKSVITAPTNDGSTDKSNTAAIAGGSAAAPVGSNQQPAQRKGVSFAGDDGLRDHRSDPLGGAHNNGSSSHELSIRSSAHGSPRRGGAGPSPRNPLLPSLAMLSPRTSERNVAGAGRGGGKLAAVAPPHSIFNAVENTSAMGSLPLPSPHGPLSGSSSVLHLSSSFPNNGNNNGSLYAGSSSAAAAASSSPPPLLRPLMAHETAPTDAVARQAERFIEAELRLLGASAERDPVAFRAASAQAYCQGVRMMLPQLSGLLGGSSSSSSASVGGGGPSALQQGGSASASSGPNRITTIIERCLRELETTLLAAAHAASQPTRSAEERARIEAELRLMYLQTAEDRARELDAREAEVSKASVNTAQRVQQLENQLAAAKQEVARLRAVQSEEGDRFSSMAQSVLESRLAAQKAELSLQQMKDRYDRVKVTEMVYMDLLKDHQDMNLMLRERRIPFKTRIHFSVDDLLGEPTAAVLAQHAAAIRERQQEEIAKAYKR